MRIAAFVSLLASLSLVEAATEVGVSVDADTEGHPVYPDRLMGTCLPIWNSVDRYDSIERGLRGARFKLFRFPNGSMSNDYHWNGKGSYTVDSVWVTDTTGYEPGFVVTSVFRGTSKHHYGFEGGSKVTDGDTGSYWWSDPFVTESRPRLLLDFQSAVSIDSVMIVWGEHAARDFSVAVWNGNRAQYPGPFMPDDPRWEVVVRKSDNANRRTGLALPAEAATHYLALRIDHGPAEGTQVAEIEAYHEGALVSTHTPRYAPDGSRQTKVVAFGAHPGNRPRADWSGGWVDWDFESFMDYVGRFDSGQAVICVNYATGTPREAAEWVRYANITRGYGIEYWQVGNEMNGAWEECGPVSARMYAEKYVAFARAMKAVDPSIKVFGPVLADADFVNGKSYDTTGLTWMESFLAYVGAREKADGAVYCDGVDFHCYPYWFANRPMQTTMAGKADYVYDMSDTLLAMIERHLLRPDSTLVFLSEYNSSVVMSSMLQRPINAAVLTAMFGGFVEKFHRRALTVVWDSYEGLSEGPDGTWGSLSLFTAAGGDLVSSLSNPPSATWWASFIEGALWLDDAVGQRFIPSVYDRSSGLRAFSLKDEEGGVRTLLANLHYDTLKATVSVNNGNGDRAVVYQWSDREYRWNGDGERAWAGPNAGPSSSSVDGHGAVSVSMPRFSLALVDFGGAPPSPHAPEFVHWGAYPARASLGDTLRVWVTARSPVGPGALTYRIGSVLDSVAPLDGTADGPMESYLLAIPASVPGTGDHDVVFSVTSAGGTAEDSLRVSVTGALRPVVLIDDFEDRDARCALPANPLWRSFAAGDNGSQMAMSLDSSDTGGVHLRADFSIIQPPDLGYDNFGALSLDLDTAWMDTVTPPLRGVRLRYAADHSAGDGRFVLHVRTTLVTDYDEFHLPLDNTDGEWRTVTFTWEELRQYGWGLPAAAPPAAAVVTGLEFRAFGEGEGFVAIDDLAFLSDTGAAIDLRTAGTPRGPGSTPAGSRPFLTRDGRLIFELTPGAVPHSVELYDARGALVQSVLEPEPSAGRYIQDVSRLAGGVYYLRSATASGITVFRLVKPH